MSEYVMLTGSPPPLSLTATACFFLLFWEFTIYIIIEGGRNRVIIFFSPKLAALVASRKIERVNVSVLALKHILFRHFLCCFWKCFFDAFACFCTHHKWCNMDAILPYYETFSIQLVYNNIWLLNLHVLVKYPLVYIISSNLYIV